MLREHLLIQELLLDNVDGNISSRIVVAGDAVNVNVGTYIITYNVKMLHLMQQLKLQELLSLLQQVRWRRR
jgi:hypothetical protein